MIITCWFSIIGNSGTFSNLLLRELSFLILPTGVKEFLEGCQIYWPCFIELPIFLPIHDGVAKF